MSKTYTKREIAYNLSCSPKTIDIDVEWFGFTPERGDRGINLYSDRQYQLIRQMREHCANGANTRNSFVPKVVTEVVEENAVVKRMVRQVEKVPIVESLQLNLMEQIRVDPFYDLQMLQRISDNRWLLPAKRLAPLLGIKPKYLNSLSRYEYCGFVAIKEMYLRSSACWKVEVMTIA